MPEKQVPLYALFCVLNFPSKYKACWFTTIAHLANTELATAEYTVAAGKQLLSTQGEAVGFNDEEA